MNYILFISIALFWGGSFIAIKEVVAVIPPILAATLRLGTAIIFLVVFYRVTGRGFSVPRKALLKVWGAGLFMFGLPFAFLFWGEQHVSPGLAGILNGCTPVFTFILSVIFLRGTEKVSGAKIFGLALAMVGMILIFYPKLHASGDHQELFGAISVFLMAVCYGIGTTMARGIFSGSGRIDIYASLFQQLLSSFAFLLVLSFFLEGWHINAALLLGWPVLTGTIYMGWISTSIAFMFYYSLIETWGSIRTSTVTYLVPMTALILDFIFNRKIPTSYEFAGALVIFSGVALIQVSNFLNKARVT